MEIDARYKQIVVLLLSVRLVAHILKVIKDSK